jgi:hypothetical protein
MEVEIETLASFSLECVPLVIYLLLLLTLDLTDCSDLLIPYNWIEVLGYLILGDKVVLGGRMLGLIFIKHL